MLTFVGLLVVILPMSNAQQPCSKDGKPCTWMYFKNISVGNQALRRSNHISSHNIHRLGECHHLCINQSNCHGYNYRVRPSSIYTANCQLSNSTVKMNITRMKNGPWVYYEDVLNNFYYIFAEAISRGKGKLHAYMHFHHQGKYRVYANMWLKYLLYCCFPHRRQNRTIFYVHEFAMHKVVSPLL